MDANRWQKEYVKRAGEDAHVAALDIISDISKILNETLAALMNMVQQHFIRLGDGTIAHTNTPADEEAINLLWRLGYVIEHGEEKDRFRLDWDEFGALKPPIAVKKTQGSILREIIGERVQQEMRLGELNFDNDYELLPLFLGGTAQVIRHGEFDNRALRTILIQATATLLAWIECMEHPGRDARGNPGRVSARPQQ